MRPQKGRGGEIDEVDSGPDRTSRGVHKHQVALDAEPLYRDGDGGIHGNGFNGWPHQVGGLVERTPPAALIGLVKIWGHWP